MWAVDCLCLFCLGLVVCTGLNWSKPVCASLYIVYVFCVVVLQCDLYKLAVKALTIAGLLTVTQRQEMASPLLIVWKGSRKDHFLPRKTQGHYCNALQPGYPVCSNMSSTYPNYKVCALNRLAMFYSFCKISFKYASHFPMLILH